MLRKLRKHMTGLGASESGATAMMAAISMPVLIGGAGLGVDVSQWYMWQRELQHSVDQAAYAGAFAMMHGEEGGTYTYRATQEYLANLDKVSDFASDPTISLEDFATGVDNSVLVSASVSRELPFSSFLTGKAVTIDAMAQASFEAGGEFAACMVSLKEDGTTLTIGGSSTVDAACGFAALSCSEDAVVIDSEDVNTDSIVTCGTADVPEYLKDKVTEGQDGLYDLYEDIPVPDNPTSRDYKCTGNGQNKLANLQPGTYSGGLVVKCTTVLNSGIYVIDGGELDLSANYDVTSNGGVMFVLRGGARMKLGGSGNGNRLSLSPMQASDFVGTPYEANKEYYSNMLVFEDRDNNTGTPGHVLNGNSNSLIEGLIYLPDGDLQINGTADVSSQCLRISAYTIDITGNADLTTLCPTEDSTSVGSGTPRIRMVR